MNDLSGKFDKYYRKLAGLSYHVSQGNILNISGSASIGGGKYKEIHVSGAVNINGDVAAEIVEISGSAIVRGKVRAGTLNASGSIEIESVECDRVQIAGAVSIYGGSISVKSTLEIFGGLTVNGDIHSGGKVVIKGGFKISGSLKAKDVYIGLSGSKSTISDGIYSERVVVKREGAKTGHKIIDKLLHLFGGLGTGKLHTKEIRADYVDIEYTACNHVYGGVVKIGDGCRINGEVIYRDSIDISSDSFVNNYRKADIDE